MSAPAPPPPTPEERQGIGVEVELVLVVKLSRPVPDSEISGPLLMSVKSEAHVLLERGFKAAQRGPLPGGQFGVQYRITVEPPKEQPRVVPVGAVDFPNLAKGGRFRG